MSAIFQRMLENVDDTLFDIAGHSQSMEDRRNLFDAMRLLRKSARPLVESFEAALLGQKAGHAVARDFEEWTLVNDEAVEEDIVVSRVVARIEDAAKHALWEYTIRMENLPAVDQQGKAFERLRPQGVTKAFRDSVESVSIDSSTKLILFKLFERQLVSDSSTVYEGINLRLEAAGVSSKTLSRRDPHSHLAPGQPERREPPEFVASYVNNVTPSYQVPAALNSLVSSAFGPINGGGGTGYGGVPGAAGVPGAMGSAAGAVPALQGPGGQQRLSLVAQLLLDQTRGWDNSQSQAAHELLVPLLRIALADPGFFSNPQHPARAVLSSLVGAPNGADGRIAEVADRLNSLASGVQAAPSQVAPLSGAELRQFLLSQRSAGASTSARLEEGRAAAYQQIRTVGSGRDLPVGVSGFLNQIWLPMISAMHLKFGAESEEMRRAAQILQRLFGEVRWLPEMKDSAVIQAILEELEKGLRDIAVPAPLITKARSVLADGLGQPETSRKLLDLETLSERTPAAAAPAANDPQKSGAPAAAAAKPAAFMGDDAAWRAALPVSSWFRVFDRASEQTQWLSAGVFYPQSRTLAFNGFDGAARLSIERGLFLEDLVGGKAEAVDPTELQQSSIRLLCLEFTAAEKRSAKKAS